MSGELEESVAWTLETDSRLLPLMPELLADLEELGTSSRQVAHALRSAGLPPGSSVLDLGCGKGAVAVALAEQLGARVDGIDGFRPFLLAARDLAAERGVAARCVFRHGDLRSLLGQAAHYDAVLLLGLGPVSGDHERTVAGLRTLARPGGLLVLGDAYLADGAGPLPGYEAYAGHAETLRLLAARGDEIVLESVVPGHEMRATNERNTELIRRRTRPLMARHPELARGIAAYVARQERETRTLGSEVVCALWVLRVRGDPPPGPPSFKGPFAP